MIVIPLGSVPVTSITYSPTMYGVNDSVLDVGGLGAHTAVSAPPSGAETIRQEYRSIPALVTAREMGCPAGTVVSAGHMSVPRQPSSVAPSQSSSAPLSQTSEPGCRSPAHSEDHSGPPAPDMHALRPSRQTPTPRVAGGPP